MRFGIPHKSMHDLSSLSQKSVMLNTQISVNSLATSGNASLKGKVSSLEDTVRTLTEELDTHKKQVNSLKTEKETLDRVLNMKVKDTRENLMSEVKRVETEINRHFEHQKSENARLQQQVATLKQEKNILQDHLLNLKERITELEGQLGFDD